jgi:hypothetical protein
VSTNPPSSVPRWAVNLAGLSAVHLRMPRPPNPCPSQGLRTMKTPDYGENLSTHSNPRPVAVLCSTLSGHGGHCRPGGYASCVGGLCWVSMQGPRSLAVPTPARNPSGVHGVYREGPYSGWGPEVEGVAGKAPDPPLPHCGPPLSLRPEAPVGSRLGRNHPPVWVNLGGGWLDGAAEGPPGTGTGDRVGPDPTR